VAAGFGSCELVFSFGGGGGGLGGGGGSGRVERVVCWV